MKSYEKSSVISKRFVRLSNVGDNVMLDDFLNVLNRSPTSQRRHQHISSPTSVANIDVDKKKIKKNLPERFMISLWWYKIFHFGYFSRSLFLNNFFWLHFFEILLDLQELSKSSRYLNEFQVHSSSLFKNSKSEFILLLFIQWATLRVTVMPLNL